MEDQKLKFGVGVLVISSIVVGMMMTFLFGAFPRLISDDYHLSVVFPSAAGIGANTPVVRDGVRVGLVTDIRLRDEGGVLVSLAMDADHTMPHRYLPRVGSGNFVTGDAVLEFARGGEGELAAIFGTETGILDEPYVDGEFIDYGGRSESLMGMQDDLGETFTVIQNAGESVNQLAVQMRDAVGGTDEKVDKVADEAIKTLEEFQAAIRDVRAIIGDAEVQKDLQESLKQLPQLLSDTQATVNTAQKTFEDFDRVAVRFADVGDAAEQTIQNANEVIETASGAVRNIEGTFGNLELFTRPLAERSDELIEQVSRTLANLDRTLIEAQSFTASINNSNGSFKRFLEDDELYYRVRRTVENIEEASARIRPILDDVRIFSDKIARDPRQLGVRGAITKRPSYMGMK